MQAVAGFSRQASLGRSALRLFVLSVERKMKGNARNRKMKELLATSRRYDDVIAHYRITLAGLPWIGLT